MSAWTLDRARHTYSIPYWADGYFDVDEQGRMCALPHGAGGPVLPLPEILDHAAEAGLKLPLLLRFSDILGDRLRKLQAAFAGAMSELDYTGGYTAVYPIKVNPKARDYAPGSKLAKLNDAFNSRYTMMLRQLLQALTGTPKVLYTAIMNGMHGSTAGALEMMTTPIPGDPEGRTGCPTFEWLDKANTQS